MAKKSEIIRHRRSVRTFDGVRLNEEEAKKILDFARSVENPYDLAITWKIIYAKTKDLKAPVISGTDCYIAGKMNRTAHAEEAFGYTFEKVVLFAEEQGIGTTWIAGTMNRNAYETMMQVGENEVLPCISPLGIPAAKMGLKETMMRKGVKADTRLPFEELFFSGSFETPLTEETAGELKESFELVRLAPSAVNKQPWRLVLDGNTVHFYEKRSKGYVDEKGWDLQKIDIGIAMCHFAIGAEEAGKSIAMQIEDSQISVPEGVSYVASFLLD